MAIQLITNFNVNAPAPIDERSVVNDLIARDDIEFKFTGLKVYVISEDKTYVYVNNDWKLDGGGGDGGNGIYGGSGSLPGDVSVFLGTVSNNVGNRSNYLYFESDGFTDGDKSLIYNYTYRKSTGIDWDSMGFRTEQKLVPFGGSTLQGPYIEYNGTNPSDSAIRGSLNLGVGSYPNLSSRVAKISISPVGTNFYCSDDPPSEIPITIAKSVDNDFTSIGYNTSNLTDYTSESDPSYRIVFGDGITPNSSIWNFDTRIINSENWNTAIQIGANVEANVVSSNVKFLVDISSRDWDGGTSRIVSLRTPQEIIRNIEHRYTKIQMWSKGTFKMVDTEILYLEADGNSFKVTLQAEQKIKDIRAYKSESLKPEFPEGTIITIKFINSDITKPGCLILWNGSNSSKIKSDLTDATFEQNDNTKLTIIHNTSPSDNGEVITLRRFNGLVNGKTEFFWEVVSVNRERKIVTRNWTTGSDTQWNFLNPVKWLTATSSTGQYQNYDSAVVINPITSLFYPPNQFSVGSGGSQVGFSRETVNQNGFAFRMSVDGNRIVFMQGNFRIDMKEGVRNTLPGNSLRKFYWQSLDSRINIWAVGKVTNISLLPEWETVWTPVQAYARGEYTSAVVRRFEVINPILSINRVGDMLLSFEAEPTYDALLGNFMQNVNFEVWVPPFSYTAATGSFKS